MTPFLHNWAETVEIDTAFQTLVTQADSTLAEERCGLVGRPVRSMQFRWTGLSRGEAQKMLLEVLGGATAGLELPLYPDVAETTAASSGTTINCPTADRRFAVGKRVVIFELDTAGRPTNAQTPTVTVIGASSLTLSGALTGSYPTGSLVFPLVKTQPVLAPQLAFLADDVATLELTVLEPVEDALPSLAVIGSAPSGFGLQGQWPIFDLEPEWSGGVQLGLVMEAATYAQGRSVCVETRGPRPRVTVEADFLLTRAEAFELLRFFDSRGGRLSPFWLVAPMALWTPVTLNTGFVDIVEHGTASVADDLFIHVGVVMNDGTVYVRQVSTIVDSGSSWRITFTVSLPALSLADVRRITPAFFARFAEDSIREAWVTGNVCRIPFKAIEVLSEASVAL